MSNKAIRIYFIILLTTLSACSTKEERITLRTLDKAGQQQQQKSPVFIKPKTEEEVRQAYTDYIKNASKNENSRLAAISRLAEIEYELGEKKIEEQNNLQNDGDEVLDDKLYTARLDKTIKLLTTLLQDYPDAKNNDRILYQLAKAYDQQGEYQKSIKALQTLSNRYPKSRFYIEAQFRLGETAFAAGDYITAEDAYTEVIVSPNSDIFYEKSLFKRGWARYKQQLYLEAVDDYLEAIDYHDFDDPEKLADSEKNLFDEYFRAVGLSFSHLGGAEPLYEYLKNKPEFRYVYKTYYTISEIYLKQERFSDAVNTLQLFINYYPESEKIPYAHLQIITIWQDSGFTQNLHAAINRFYDLYRPDNPKWQTANYIDAQKTINQELKKYTLLSATYFHGKYQKKRKSDNYANAKKWYLRYLDHYSAYARKDKVYSSYADLLAEGKEYVEALKYYEIAAYDKELVLNKDAAYASILLTERLHKQNQKSNNKKWLNKHINYSILFSQTHPNDPRSENIILHASELAYTAKEYSKSIELAELINDNATPKTIYDMNILKAQSYFELKKYDASEAIYTGILQSEKLSNRNKRKIMDNLALSVYRQAEQALEKDKNNFQEAIRHYVRISELAASSEIAATGMFDAIALAMNHQKWDQAITYSKRFQSLYPKNKLNKDVTKKLSVAYLNSNQSIKAAREFEKLSASDDDKEIKKAALWQAAELYESKQETQSAIRSYKEYANTYKTPYPQFMEAMYKLTQLYKKENNSKEVTHWRKRILTSDKQAYKKQKTDRTKFIASTTILSLARASHAEFDRHKLVEPLQTNLRKKKTAMQNAVKLYGQASVYGIPETTTEATYSIADIYKTFSKALLESERPKSLSGDELEQYEILLEDQAFPFEDKAIEFYETNLIRTKDGIYNEWISKSLDNLKTLFPVRYARKVKVDKYINASH